MSISIFGFSPTEQLWTVVREPSFLKGCSSASNSVLPHARLRLAAIQPFCAKRWPTFE